MNASDEYVQWDAARRAKGRTRLIRWAASELKPLSGLHSVIASPSSWCRSVTLLQEMTAETDPSAKTWTGRGVICRRRADRGVKILVGQRVWP